MSRFTVRTRYTFMSIFILSVLVMTVISTYLLPAHALPVQPHFNHFLSTNYDGDGQYDDNNPTPGVLSANLTQEQNGNLAYPYTAVSYDQTIGAYNAYQRCPASINGHGWTRLAPHRPARQAMYPRRLPIPVVPLRFLVV